MSGNRDWIPIVLAIIAGPLGVAIWNRLVKPRNGAASIVNAAGRLGVNLTEILEALRKDLEEERTKTDKLREQLRELRRENDGLCARIVVLEQQLRELGANPAD